jgi:Ubiquitin-activating enzyme active site
LSNGVLNHSVILFQMYNIVKNTNKETVKAIVNSIVVPEFVPSSEVIITQNGSQLAVNGSGNDELEVLRKELTDLRPQLSGLVVSPIAASNQLF